MGEAMPEGMVHSHLKAWALLEVVRLAFEGGISFEQPDASCGTTTVDEGDVPVAAPASPLRNKIKHSRELAEQHVSVPRPASTGSSSRLVPGGPCMWCGVTATPQWRRPRGTNKLLCNACGIFFTRYGRLPEKSQHMHSTSSHGPSPSIPASPHSRLAESGLRSSLDLQPAISRQDLEQVGGAAGPDCADCPAQRPQPSAPHPHPQSSQPQPQLPQLQHLQQPLGPTSSMSGASPHKRKDAPQPEAELLRCLEDDSGSAHSLANADASPNSSLTQPDCPGAGLPTPAKPLPLPQHQLQQTGAAAGAPTGQVAAGMGCAAEGSRSSAVSGSALAVAPLDLGLQHWSSLLQQHQQHLGLLSQQLGCLSALPSLYLQGPAAGAAGSLPGLAVPGCSGQTAGAASAASAAAVAAAAAMHAQLHGQPMFVPGLSAELLARPFLLPPGLMSCGLSGLLDAAAAAAAASTAAATAAGGSSSMQQVYARPSKRHERLPAGDSDDSNTSTDSHAAAHHVDASTSYEDDDGGTNAATGAAGAARDGGATGSGSVSMSCSPPVMPSAGLQLPPGLFGGATTVPLLQSVAAAAPGSPSSMAASAAAATATALRLGMQGVGAAMPFPLGYGVNGLPPAADGGACEGDEAQPQPVILLHTRRSKGPRSRVSSVTPSSSTAS